MVTIDYRESERALLFSFTGRMDTYTCQEAAETVNRTINETIGQESTAAQTGTKIVFDLKEVNFISSSFIRICVSTAKQAGPGDFSITNCDPLIKKTFKIAGLDEALKVK